MMINFYTTTKNILFISGGAFDGIEQYISRRLNTRKIGYGSNKDSHLKKDNFLQYTLPQDLKSFGLIPELIGRMPIITHLDSLDKKALIKILTEPKNAILKQYTKLFKIDNINLSFEKGAIEQIVNKAIEYKIGARGLRSICEIIMLDDMFRLPSDKKAKDLLLTQEYVKKKLNKLSLESLKAA